MIEENSKMKFRNEEYKKIYSYVIENDISYKLKKDTFNLSSADILIEYVNYLKRKINLMEKIKEIQKKKG